MIEIIEYCLKIYIPIWFLKNCSKYMRKYNKGNIMYFFSIGYKFYYTLFWDLIVIDFIFKP